MSERRRSYSIEAKVVAPIFERFHSFKDFMQYQADTLEPGAAVGLYDQYKYDFKIFSARKMFAQSQDRGFVRDRYSPEHLRLLCFRKVTYARSAAQSFLNLLLQEHALDDVSLTCAIPTDHLQKEPQSGRIIGSLDPAQIRSKKTGVTEITMKAEEDAAAPASAVSANVERFFTCASAANRTLVLKKLPPDVTLQMLEELCAGTPGFLGATLIPSCLTDEHRGPLLLQASKDTQDCTDVEQAAIQHSLSECYVRAKGGALFPLLTGWLEFDSEESCAAAELSLDQKPIGDMSTAKPLKLRADRPRRINIASVAPTERLARELDLARNLISKLDADFAVYSEDPIDGSMSAELKEDEKADEDDKADEDEEKREHTAQRPTAVNLFLKSIESIPESRALDICMLYLRYVHLADLYCGRICWTPRELLETCGPGTFRLEFNAESEVELIENEGYLTTVEDSVLFDKRIDELQHLPFGDIKTEVTADHPLFQSHWLEFAEENTLRVDDEKYRCGICKKLFKGPDYVHKHLKNKHQDEINSLIKNVYFTPLS
ncbi:arsenite-resistance protein 2 [Gregarina niphandrodes]|uniref:Arsenite-resistance protein 2 n=1 Tax=Gregarina niphandrodes TaxID=110365 RepID=A0A023B3I2_GRENI|nr:arsenite-resistance protein 2 [Gregarina niphandrodes]EZG55389.1 arsenite-resistance protein 2 [Gregarina niphandrodes]|eukprot:XP_011131589.1 arsenite-resistance protein 2 [Gregarina niphandrodes]